MKMFDYIKGFKTYVKNDGLMVKVKDKYSAWNLKNKVELEGFAVNVEKNNSNYVVSIWGAQLMDAYLLNNLQGFAA